MSEETQVAKEPPKKENPNGEHKSVWKVVSQRAFLTVFIGNILVCISFNIINAGLVVHFTEDYGFNVALVGTVVSLFSFLSLVMKPISSPIIDRFDRKKLLIGAYVILGIGTVFMAFANTIETLYAAQVVRGIGWGVSMGLNAVILADVVGKADFGLASGLFMLGPVVGSSVVAPFAIPVADAITYSGLFLVSAGFAFADALLICTLPYNWVKPEPKEKGEKKKVKVSDFIDWASIPYMLVSAMFSIAVYGQGSTILLAYGRADLAIANVGIMVTVHNVIMYFTRPIFGRIIDTKGARWGLIPGFFAVAAANFVTAASTDMIGLLIASVIYGVGGGGLIASRTMAIKGAPEDRIGVAGNTYLMGSDIGQTLGPIVFTGIAAMVGGMYRPAYIILGSIVVVSFIIWMIFIKFLMKRHPKNEMGW